MTEENTNLDVTTKNIIITLAENHPIPNGGGDVQEIMNIGELNGYYITNGKAIPIKCTKKDNNSQTIYTKLNGEEIKVNDGNTWINVCPINAKLIFE